MRKPVAAAVMTIALATVLPAQNPQSVPNDRLTRRRFLPELRADLSYSDVSSGQVAAGFHVNTGTYVRFAGLAGIGTAWNGDDEGQSYRFELQGRFHMDPFRNTRFGLYGLGGIAATHDPFLSWQSRLVVGTGVELPAHGRATWAIEAAFAGGFRISILTRRIPIGRR